MRQIKLSLKRPLTKHCLINSLIILIFNRDPILHYEIKLNSIPTSVIASKFDVLNTFEKRLKLFMNHPLQNPMTDVYVSESFHQKTGKDIGDTINIVGDKGAASVVINIFFIVMEPIEGLFK